MSQTLALEKWVPVAEDPLLVYPKAADAPRDRGATAQNMVTRLGRDG